MTNRREFLHLGVAALSLPIAVRAGVSPGILAPGGCAEAQALPLYKVFFDERFASCLVFAGEMKRRGLPTHAIRGDITDAWFNDLYQQWKTGPAAIAGLTAPGPVFCLEMLARDAGLRVELRVDHRPSPPRHITHELAAPVGLLVHAPDIVASAERWPEQMAELVARFPAEHDAMQKTTLQAISAWGSNDPEHLVSWVIAPARRA